MCNKNLKKPLKLLFKSSHEQKIIDDLFMKLISTSVIAYALGTFGMFIDNLMVARFMHNDALIAFGLVSPLSFLILLFGDIGAVGAYVCASQSKGTNNPQKANEFFSFAI